MPEIFNVFPLSIYVDKINKHEIYKENFYKVYPKYDYVENERSDTVSEGQSDPIIHLEPTLSPLFTEIADHVRSYIYNTLKFREIFNITFTKTWLSRMRDLKGIPLHIHSTSHISFVYYLNMPPNAHKLKFLNPHNKNSFFLGMSLESRYEERTMVKEFNQLNSEEFYIHPPEGTVALFPSSIQHCTQCVDKSFDDERLAIVGDITLTLKEDQLQYSMGYIDQKYWKKYK